MYGTVTNLYIQYIKCSIDLRVAISATARRLADCFRVYFAMFMYANCLNVFYENHLAILHHYMRQTDILLIM